MRRTSQDLLQIMLLLLYLKSYILFIPTVNTLTRNARLPSVISCQANRSIYFSMNQGNDRMSARLHVINEKSSNPLQLECIFRFQTPINLQPVTNIFIMIDLLSRKVCKDLVFSNVSGVKQNWTMKGMVSVEIDSLKHHLEQYAESRDSPVQFTIEYSNRNLTDNQTEELICGVVTSLDSIPAYNFITSLPRIPLQSITGFGPPILKWKSQNIYCDNEVFVISPDGLTENETEFIAAKMGRTGRFMSRSFLKSMLRKVHKLLR